MDGEAMLVRRALERTYDAEMLIFPYCKRELESGETVLEEGEPSSPVPCALSRSGTGRARAKTFESGGETVKIHYFTSLICAPEVEVKAGSRILVRLNGREYNFLYTGESFGYKTHQELQLERLGDA